MSTTARKSDGPRAFRLYPDGPDQHWWSRNDYGAVVDAMARLQADGQPVARVLEFGPGWSTRALIEGGATHIDTCEDDPVWAQTHEARLVPQFPTPAFPATVRLHRYTWSHGPLTIPAVDGQWYDLAFIDGPLGSNQRPDVLRYALAHAAAVLLPTEDRNPALRIAITDIAAAHGLTLDIRETGPLSGGFALLTRPKITPAIGERADDADPGVAIGGFMPDDAAGVEADPPAADDAAESDLPSAAGDPGTAPQEGDRRGRRRRRRSKKVD